MIQPLKQRIETAIGDKVFPGCVVGIMQPGKGGTILPFGRFTYDNNSALMKEDAIFDVASITKL